MHSGGVCNSLVGEPVKPYTRFIRLCSSCAYRSRSKPVIISDIVDELNSSNGGLSFLK